MARYARRSVLGGTELIAVLGSEFPELTITTSFDDGEVLVLIGFLVQNTAAAARAPVFQLLVDGAAQLQLGTKTTIPASGFLAFAWHWFVAISAGVHTFSVKAFGDTDLSQQLIAEECTITVIQLPLWASTDNMS